MSLTNHLKDKKSPIRAFLRTQFPDTRAFLKDARQQLRSVDPIRPDNDVQGRLDTGHSAGGIRYPWGTIGTALDYRIRYYFDVTSHDEFVAYNGARLLTDPPIHAKVDTCTIRDLPAGVRSDFLTDVQIGFRLRRDRIEFFEKEAAEWLGSYRYSRTGSDGPMSACTSMPAPTKITREIVRSIGGRLEKLGFVAQDNDNIALESVYQDFFRGLDSLARREGPVATRLTKAGEDEINRHCIVLALFDEVFRMGGGPNSPLFTREHTSAGNLLDIPEAHWISDLRNLSWSFYDNFNHLLSLPCSLNPTFDGSRDVGGADADLIVDGALIDIKTTIEPKIRNEWLWQLLGYVLLDYSNRQGIDKVGMYLARQGLLFQWDLEEAIRGLCPAQPPRVDGLRTEFEQVAKSSRRRLPTTLGSMPSGDTTVFLSSLA